MPFFIFTIRLKMFANYYYAFFIFIISGLINEIIHFDGHSTYIQNISSNVYYILETQCILYLLLHWGKVQKFKIIISQIIFLCLLILEIILKVYIQLYFFNCLYLLLLSILIVIGLNFLTKHDNNELLSKKLIIIPFIIYSVYLILINILMYFLYNKQTKQLFINLYSVINVINFLSYISYSLALLWAPKKEKYL